MMNSFLNRENEIKTLQDLYAAPGSRLVVLYGRRRLGKTSLLREFSRDKSAIYYMADKAAEVSQREALARTMATSLGESLLHQVRYDSWYDLFAAFDRVRDPRCKTVLMFDEYQYLCQTQPAFSSYLQKWWDEHWRDGNVLLILCGSLTSMMYRETLSSASPLYGRTDGHILLRPLPYTHIPAFLDDPAEINCVERFALCGGVPRYLELLAPFATFDEALKEGVLSPTAPLHSEPRYLLQDEIDVPNVCWSLLEAVASGATRISELASRLARPASSLTRYIALLRDLSILEREVPVAEKSPAKSKRGVYTFTDPFLRLWFGCVYPFESFFEMQGDNATVMERLRPRLDQHIQHTYERLCRDYTRRHHAVPTETIKVGRQWGPHYEIDVAGVNTAHELTLAGECKWSTSPVGLSVLRDLQSKVNQTSLPTATDLRLLLFSRSGFTPELHAHAAETPSIHLIDRIFPACPPDCETVGG